VNERVCHITTVHDPFDPRIFHKEMRSLADVGYTMTLLAVHDRHEVVNGIEVIPFERPRNRVDRMIRLGWCAYRAALRQRADLYHFHDPEFLPWAWLLRRVHKKKVIYDVHEYYPERAHEDLAAKGAKDAGCMGNEDGAACALRQAFRRRCGER
jgi:hypothetical protein